MVPLKNKRFRDTPAFGNTIALAGIAAVIIALGVFVPRAEAESADAELIAQIQEIGCMPMYKVAEVIMQGRQDGDTLPTSLERVKGVEQMEDIVKDAYKVTHYETEEYQAKAVKAFAESQFTKCETFNKNLGK